MRVGYATIWKKAHVQFYTNSDEHAAIIALAGYYQTMVTFPENWNLGGRGDYRSAMHHVRIGSLDLATIKREARRMIGEACELTDLITQGLVDHGTVLFEDDRKKAAKSRGEHYRLRWRRMKERGEAIPT